MASEQEELEFPQVFAQELVKSEQSVKSAQQAELRLLAVIQALVELALQIEFEQLG